MKGCGREIAGFPCCTVIHGDCAEHLWKFNPGDVDLVVTDPPYGMEYVSGARKNKWDAIAGDDCFPFETVNQLIKIPKLASYFYCRWDNLWEHGSLPKPSSVITWVKPGTGMGDLKHEHGRATEVALFYPGPEHAFKKRPCDVIRPCDVLEADRTRNELHSTQKPQDLIRKMLDWYNFETVFDPFIGSGTTGRVAKDMGKHFLGFEVDAGIHKRAVEFIEAGVTAQPLRFPSPNDSQQGMESLFNGGQ